MKLYFCAKCGKRLSEVDVEKGEARNKKLKGVYCLDCSIGVTTLETLPLSNDEAAELVAQQERTAGPLARKARTPATGPARRARKGDSKPALRARQANAGRDSSSRVEVAQQPNMLPWVGGGVTACAFLLVLAWMFSGPNDGATPKKARKTAKASKGSADASFAAEKTGPTKVSNVPVDPAATTPEQSKEQRAEAARSRLSRKLASMPEKDKDAKLAAIESYLKAFDGTFAAMQVRQWGRNLKSPGQTPVVEAKPATQPSRQAPPPDAAFPSGIKRNFDQPGKGYDNGLVEETQVGGQQARALRLRRSKWSMRADITAWSYPKDSIQKRQKGIFYMPRNARIRFRYYAERGNDMQIRFEEGNGSALYQHRQKVKHGQWVQVDLPLDAFTHVQDARKMPSGILCSTFTMRIFCKGKALAYVDDIEVVEGD